MLPYLYDLFYLAMSKIVFDGYVISWSRFWTLMGTLVDIPYHNVHRVDAFIGDSKISHLSDPLELPLLHMICFISHIHRNMICFMIMTSLDCYPCWEFRRLSSEFVYISTIYLLISYVNEKNFQNIELHTVLDRFNIFVALCYSFSSFWCCNISMILHLIDYHWNATELLPSVCR